MLVLVEAASASDGWKEALSFLGVLTAAVISVWVGALAFFRQKEYELVQYRYLQKGFDELIAVGELALNSHNQNWAHILNVLKVLRDVPSEVEVSEVALERFTPSVRIFPYAAASRVMRLTQSRAPWEAIQLVASFSNRSYEFCAIEVPKVVRAFIEERANGTNEEIAAESSEHLKTLMEEADIYLDVLGQLSVLAIEFERSRFDFRSVRKFSERALVKEAIAKLDKMVSAQAGGLGVAVDQD